MLGVHQAFMWPHEIVHVMGGEGCGLVVVGGWDNHSLDPTWGQGLGTCCHLTWWHGHIVCKQAFPCLLCTLVGCVLVVLAKGPAPTGLAMVVGGLHSSRASS